MGQVKESKQRDLSYKASADVFKSVGLLASPVQSQTLVNIYQQQNINSIPPLIRQLLEKQNEEIKRLASQEQVIEGEEVEDD